eukprot:4875965-Prymnesium_polylepis.1
MGRSRFLSVPAYSSPLTVNDLDYRILCSHIWYPIVSCGFSPVAVRTQLTWSTNWAGLQHIKPRGANCPPLLTRVVLRVTPPEAARLARGARGHEDSSLPPDTAV